MTGPESYGAAQHAGLCYLNTLTFSQGRRHKVIELALFAAKKV